MSKRTALFAVLLFSAACTAPIAAAASNAKPVTNNDRVIAIDVLLEPDATMVAKAKALNAALRANYPKGYTLGAEHAPHITLVQCYVHEDELSAIAKSIERVAARERPAGWTLTAAGLDHGVWAGVAITSVRVDHTRELDRLQAAVVEAVEPYRVKSGTRAAFSTSRELPQIDRDIIDYVEQFATKSSLENYKPHVTIGVAKEDFVKQLKAKRFERFSFRPAGVAIYQLGNFGTAQKKLWEWKSK